VDFKYTPTPPEVTYVTRVEPTGLRNDFSAFVGMRITMGANPVTVTKLGRFMANGNRGTHVLKLVQNGLDVPGGSVAVAMSGGTVGQFVYANLSRSVVLTAGMTYYLVSEEMEEGDTWYDADTRVTTTGVATENGYASGLGPGAWYYGETPCQTFGPVDFVYVLAQ
jgi:hypothetical protein